ncbi:MAG: hypothetical protein AAF549_07565 [Pseudomonadota bacterium]
MLFFQLQIATVQMGLEMARQQMQLTTDFIGASAELMGEMADSVEIPSFRSTPDYETEGRNIIRPAAWN